MFLSVTSRLCEAGVLVVVALKIKQVPCENQCGTGNEGDGVLSDPKVWVFVQSPTSTHVLH